MISLLCPTRGRPENMRRFYDFAIANADLPSDVRVIFYIDEDDLVSCESLPAGAFCVIGRRQTLSDCWNVLLTHSQATGPIFGLCGDDVVIRTPHWDTIVMGAFPPDRIAYVHGDDGLQGDRLGTHGFVHREWIHAVGYFTPPGFSSDYVDTWLTEVADLIGRRVYLSNLHTEHLHPDAGKAPMDQTYAERIERGHRDQTHALYASRADERQRDADLLRAVMQH